MAKFLVVLAMTDEEEIEEETKRINVPRPASELWSVV